MVPISILEKFTSDELELLFNGKPFIDIEEWKENTEYGNGCNQFTNTIKWFWEVMSDLNQTQLSNFLLFSTGSGRVPLGGFAELESNRGNITKYKINSVDYVPGVKNFIKAHTCFNRIDLPKFPEKKLVMDAVDFIANSQLFGFGIE
jgi:E3 ubiquitin-protein ligase HUWE1